MANIAVKDVDVATPSVVQQAARDFARALAATAQFQAFDEADHKLRSDETAQRVIGAYQSKQQSTRMAMMLGSASAGDRAELERLQQEFVANPSVAAYLQAQSELQALCQAAAEQLSRHIGLSFAGACGGGCC